MKKNHLQQIKKVMKYTATFVFSAAFAIGASFVLAQDSDPTQSGGLPPFLHSGPQVQRVDTNLSVGQGALGTSTLKVKDFVEFNRVMFVGEREFNPGATEANLDVANKTIVGLPNQNGTFEENDNGNQTPVNGSELSAQITGAVNNSPQGINNAKAFVGGNALVNGLIKNSFLARTTGTNAQLAWEGEQEPVCTDPDGYLILCNEPTEPEEETTPEEFTVDLNISPGFALVPSASIESDNKFTLVPVAHAVGDNEAGEPVDVTLTWNITGGTATQCFLQKSTNSPFEVSASATGSHNDEVEATTTFTITCTDDVNVVSDDATIALSIYEEPGTGTADASEPFTCIRYVQDCEDLPSIENTGNQCQPDSGECGPSPQWFSGCTTQSGAPSEQGEIFYCGQYNDASTWVFHP